MTITFVNRSEKVSDEDLQNSVTNLYNNSPKFRKLVDGINATGVPTEINITDEGVSKWTSEKKDFTYPIVTERLKYDHTQNTPQSNGVIPNKDGEVVSKNTININTKDFSSNSRTPAAYPQEDEKLGKAGPIDEDNDRKADIIYSMTFERFLSHELYHVQQAHDGKIHRMKKSDIMDVADKHKIENEATQFEEDVMKDITPSDDPRRLPRSYFGEIRDSALHGVTVYRPSPDPSIPPQFVNTEKPDPSKPPPWEWRRPHMHRSEAHPEISSNEPATSTQQTQSNFMPAPTDDAANKSAFTPDIATQQQAANILAEPVTPETAPPPSTPDSFTV